jgi:hypothetical protein
MRLPVDLQQLRGVDVGISLRGGQLHVPEKLLNGTEVCAALEQMTGKRVPQSVWADPEPGAAP